MLESATTIKNNWKPVVFAIVIVNAVTIPNAGDL